MRIRFQARLPLQRNIDKQRHRQPLPDQRLAQPIPRPILRLKLQPSPRHPNLRHLEHLTPQQFPSREGEDLCVGKVGERFDRGHADDEFSEDDEVFRVTEDELVDEVLEDEPEGGLHLRPATVDVTGEGGETCNVSSSNSYCAGKKDGKR
jgi:hypothetical protein